MTATIAAAPGRTRRTIRTAAWVGAWLGALLAPLHALARFATTEGAGDLANPLTRAWAEPAAEVLRPLLSWGGADTVYLAYGRVWLVVVGAATLCALTVRSERDPAGLERWGWRLALPGYVVLTTGLLVTYWTPWLEPGFMFLVVPGMLLSLIGSTVLGIGLLGRRGGRPATRWLLALWLPSFVALSAVIALGAAVLPMVWAWALAGRSPTS